MSALARDSALSESTAYAYRDEGIAVLAQQEPSLHGALLTAKATGHSHVIVDGTLVHTDRIAPSATRVDPDLLERIAERVTDGQVSLADLGYEGEPDVVTVPIKKPRQHDLTDDQQAYNASTAPALPRRTRQLATENQRQGAASLLWLLLADRPDCRRRTGSPPPQQQPHHLIQTNFHTE